MIGTRYKNSIIARRVCEEFKNNLDKMASEEITTLIPLNNSLSFKLELNMKYQVKFATNPTHTYIKVSKWPYRGMNFSG